MKHLKPQRLALLVSMAFSAPMLMAQQATDVGRIQIEGQPGGSDSGLITQEETPKARSSVNKQYLEKSRPRPTHFRSSTCCRV